MFVRAIHLIIAYPFINLFIINRIVNSKKGIFTSLPLLHYYIRGSKS